MIKAPLLNLQKRSCLFLKIYFDVLDDLSLFKAMQNSKDYAILNSARQI